jgi:hypothetical protein
MTVDMVLSRATFRLGRTRGTPGLRQCGRIELMSSMVDIEARIKVCTPLGRHCRTVPRYVILNCHLYVARVGMHVILLTC